MRLYKEQRFNLLELHWYDACVNTHHVSADVSNDRGGKAPASDPLKPVFLASEKGGHFGLYLSYRYKKRVANAHPQNQRNHVSGLMLRVGARMHRAGGFYRAKHTGQAEKTAL